MTDDIRWQQRFSNYQKALAQLEAFRLGLIEAGDTWMLMIQDRNLTSHTYNRATADAIGQQILCCYLPCFQQLRAKLEQRQLEEGG
jgi:nucleotidyltransferase substrate binding protein (TIGR01987 family)